MERLIIGIDLGTTNCAVAFIRPLPEEDEQHSPDIELYEIPQLVAPGEGAPHRTLPSFLYIAGTHDITSESLWLPWDEQARSAVGILAREQGALVPARLVSSAKSWLCYSEVDRRAKILPWGSDLGEDACSPVEASTRYLAHIRDAWNYEAETGETGIPKAKFEQQEIVLTVPASFDEEARELTVEAARKAGLERFTLLEEPLAAFYSWIAAHNRQFDSYVDDGDTILVCDVGGGTTDFSLISVSKKDGEVTFERVAVGEHLLLGGDNVDHALARIVEAKLSGARLSIDQRASLLRQCCAAKEQLLSTEAPASITIRIAGGGSSFIGSSLQAELTREEVLHLLLEGFLPAVTLDEKPHKERRAGLRQIGLPYESDPAITRHLAAFLSEACKDSSQPVKPAAILFNGGFFKPDLLRERLCNIVGSWFAQNWKPKLLSNHSLDTAVAVGAAYYGLVRQTGGIRVGAGSPRAYYIAVAQQQEQENTLQAVCVLPRGVQEGTKLTLDGRLFELQANRPVVFTLWSSHTRQGDRLGDLITASTEQFHLHSPLDTIIRYGKRSNARRVPVKLEVEFTEVGTLELWCRSQVSEHRWRLQFQLRKNAPQIKAQARTTRTSSIATPASTAIIEAECVSRALEMLNEVFAANPTANPVDLMGRLEEVLQHGRDAWPLEVIRQMADRLLDLAEGRRHSPRHEARWLNLTGFCLRPGFGHQMDEVRMVNARRIYHTGLVWLDDEQVQAEWMVFCRRIAGGFTRGQQIEFYNRYASTLIGKKRRRLNPQVERESWRTLASLEAIEARQKTELGNALTERLMQQATEHQLWAIGRLGARIPFAATIDTVVPARVASRWVEILLGLKTGSGDTLAAALAAIAACSGDPVRDLDEKLRQRVEMRLLDLNREDLVKRLWEYLPPERKEAERVFGESLPDGLRLLE